ncbi:MAG: LPP20 family lipoprotein, partial [Desulfobacterales bacterium]|nr:LPP20 family lipoprotein [Desulfobacterales bacterium]
MRRINLGAKPEAGSAGKQLQVVFIFMILLMLGGFGCAKTPSPAEEAGVEFPEERYLTARGTGETGYEAGKQAMAELSGIFESRISSQFTSLATSTMTQDQAEAFEKNMASRIRIDSDMHLQGARIGRSWKDEKTGLYSALAVLDRSDAGQTWASQVDTIDSEIRAEVRALETTRGPLSRMAGLNRIIDRITDRRILEGYL